MQEIVKICKKHGNLTKDQIHPKGKSKTGKQYYGCLLCKRIVAKRFKENNLESVKKSQHKYDQKKVHDPEWQKKRKVWMYHYQKNRRKRLGEKLRKMEIRWKRTFYKKHRDKLVEKQREMTANLHFSYVKYHLKRHYGFDDPSDDLIHAKATLMLLKREIMKVSVGKGKDKYVAKTKKYKRRSTDRDAESRIIEGTTKDFINSKII